MEADHDQQAQRIGREGTGEAGGACRAPQASGSTERRQSELPRGIANPAAKPCIPPMPRARRASGPARCGQVVTTLGSPRRGSWLLPRNDLAARTWRS